MAIFTLTIAARTAKCGERPDQERSYVAEMLSRAAQQIGGGSAPLGGQNVSEPQNLNPTNCSYAFGPGSMNAPVSPNSGTSAGGTAVTIKGVGFTGLTAAQFGGVAATNFVVVDDATITCTTPAHTAGVVDVTIGAPARQTLPGVFTFT